MGLNISGIAIDKVFENKIEELNSKFGWNLEFEKEITFEEASANFKDEGIADIYFSKNGTLIFLSDPYMVDAKNSIGNKVLGFGYLETPMAFVFNYYEDGTVLREIVTHNGEVKSEQGNQLEIESDNKDVTELIFEQMSNLIGERFWDVDNGATAKRYRFVSKSNEQNTNQLEQSKKTESKVDENNPLIQEIKKIAHSKPEGKSGFVKKMGAIEVLEGRLDPKLYASKVGLKIPSNSNPSQKKWWQFWK